MRHIQILPKPGILLATLARLILVAASLGGAIVLLTGCGSGMAKRTSSLSTVSEVPAALKTVIGGNVLNSRARPVEMVKVRLRFYHQRFHFSAQPIAARNDGHGFEPNHQDSRE